MDQDFLLRTTRWGAAAAAVDTAAVGRVPAIPAQWVVDEGASALSDAVVATVIGPSGHRCADRTAADWDFARWPSGPWSLSDWS